jgi:GTP-binding protein
MIDALAGDVTRIVGELEKYGSELAGQERWLVLTKKDLVLDEEFEERKQQLLASLGWQGPVYEVSSMTGEGTQQLVYDLMAYLEELKLQEEAPEQTEDDKPWSPLD